MKKIIIAIFSLIITCIVCELVFRFLTHTDENGERRFGPVVLYPYRMPVVSLQKSIERFTSGEDSRFAYDADLGWRFRPHARSSDGMYRYNNLGLRRNTDTDIKKAPGVTRVLLFGDSVTHADDVNFEDSWGHILERLLESAGHNIEILNLGVSAYGMDQALLYWEIFGEQLNPDIVIFGFQPENVKRNVNMVRMFYTHSSQSLPFTKPRFAIKKDKLQTINVPTLPPNELLSFAKGERSWDAESYEHFFNRKDYQESWLLKSRLFSFALSALKVSNKYSVKSNERMMYALENQPAKITLKIIERFRSSVEKSGAEFLVLHLPRPLHLSQMLEKDLVYQGILDRLKLNYDFIDTSELLLPIAKGKKLGPLFIQNAHLSPAGNKILAEHLVTDLKKLVE